MSVIIITESTADLPRDYIDAHPCLRVKPMVFQFGGVPELDIAGETDNHANYDRLRAGEVATTSQLNTEEIKDFIRPFLSEGDDVLYLAFSSGLSGTCSNGMLAASDLSEEFPDRQIKTVDTLAASLEEGLIVAMAVRRYEQTGEGVEQLAAYVESIRLKINAWFTVDELKYLRRGGRVSATAAVIGTMLSIKPILHVDNEGHLIPIHNERGRKRSIKALADHMAELYDSSDDPLVFIGHSDCPEDANSLAALVEERFGIKPTIINYIGLVIGSHSGPGTLALFFPGTSRGGKANA